jgi:beta-galactosidase
MEGNSPVLAWIAGPPGAFTAKDHHFYPGEMIEKQIAVINDERTELDYEVQWGVIVDGNRIARRTESGRISPGRSLLVPVGFKAPDVQNPADGVMIIWARIGTKVTNDSFKFRVYPRPAAPAGAVALIHDPAGDTKSYVDKLGWKTVPWDGKPAEGKLLIIGRRALSSGGSLPGSLAKFVESGGRVVIFGQDPEWLRKTVGLRVSRHVSRRFFPLAANSGHPVVRGLDETDLADWRGSGTLVPDTADTDLSVNRDWYPPFGWHWGNRGSVSSAAIEKPHHAGWRPLVDGEFDLAYSPLLETFLGKGMAVWCMLDVEGRTDSDPVADIITTRLLDYAATAVFRPRAPRTVYLGDSRDRAMLKSLGLVFQDAPPAPVASEARHAPTSLAPRGPGLLVVGSGARVADSLLERFMADGGDVFFLPFPAGRLPLGFKAESVTEFSGATDIPGWEELTGLSASDVRLRTNVAADLLTGGPGSVVAQGILGRYRTDGGMALFFQLDPRRLDAEKNTYLRYSEWRVTRGLTQLLANLGAEFEMDRKGLDWGWRGEYEAIPLAGEWKYRIERRLDPAPDGKPWKDDGIAGTARGWARTGLDDSGWGSMKLPCEWETLGKDWKIDGAVWFRREITVPKTWAGKNLRLTIGAVDDFDVTYFNGVRIGATGLETPNFWATRRDYQVPASLVKTGRNVVAIRVFDHYGGGGVVGRPEELALKRVEQPAVDFYVPGFRTDPVLGDDPYRYFRW